MNLRFDRFTVRQYDGHPVHSYVDVFYKHSPVKPYKNILTQPFAKDFNTISKNVIITSNNASISDAICNEFGCVRESQWITIPKHLSEVLAMDMVVLMNTYCDMIKKDQIWDLYYYTGAAVPLSVFRYHLQSEDHNDGDQDISLLP